MSSADFTVNRLFFVCCCCCSATGGLTSDPTEVPEPSTTAELFLALAEIEGGTSGSVLLLEVVEDNTPSTGAEGGLVGGLSTLVTLKRPFLSEVSVT